MADLYNMSETSDYGSSSIVEEKPPVIETIVASDKELLMQALVKTHSRKERVIPDLERKTKILSSLPEDFIEQMYAFLKAKEIDQMKFSSETGRPYVEPSESDLAGRLFEVLVENDPEIYLGPNIIAEELLGLVQNPDRFGMNNVRHMRCPDIAFLKEDDSTHNIYITGAGEVKLARKLDKRVYAQLRNSGIKNSLETITSTLNHTLNLDKYGLSDIAKVEAGGKKLLVSNDFKITLVFPANRDITRVEDLIDEANLGSDANAFATLLNDPKKIEIKKSPFTSQEIAGINVWLFSEISKRYYKKTS